MVVHRKTECVRGHSYTPENTYTHASGTRSCIACKRDKNRVKRVCEQCGVDTTGTVNKKYCTNCAPAERNAHWCRCIRQFGVDKQMFDAMYFEQNGKCALPSCPNEATDIDHHHVTGKVRGLLCRRCNLGMGAMENVNWRIEATMYLEEYDAD